MESLLQAENISKRYGDKLLFENISLSIGEGQKIALVAKNGTGKTSLLNILAGPDSPDGALFGRFHDACDGLGCRSLPLPRNTDHGAGRRRRAGHLPAFRRRPRQ